MTPKRKTTSFDSTWNKNMSNWIISSSRAKNKKYLKRPTRTPFQQEPNIDMSFVNHNFQSAWISSFLHLNCSHSFHQRYFKASYRWLLSWKSPAATMAPNKTSMTKTWMVKYSVYIEREFALVDVEREFTLYKLLWLWLTLKGGVRFCWDVKLQQQHFIDKCVWDEVFGCFKNSLSVFAEISLYDHYWSISTPETPTANDLFKLCEANLSTPSIRCVAW